MRLAYQFQGQKVKGQVTRPINADTHRAQYFPNANEHKKMPTNFKLGIQMEDDDPHQPQAP